jgi:hypothetical protein
MNALTPPIPMGGGVGSISSGSGKKIIQRIPLRHLSDRLKESRMADADAELVLQSQNGNPAAFETLIRNH